MAAPYGQLNGAFNHQFFRSVSAMFHSRGLLIEADVQAILRWPCWQVDGPFNHELFRSFSSMLSGRRLPKEQEAPSPRARVQELYVSRCQPHREACVPAAVGNSCDKPFTPLSLSTLSDDQKQYTHQSVGLAVLCSPPPQAARVCLPSACASSSGAPGSLNPSQRI